MYLSTIVVFGNIDNNKKSSDAISLHLWLVCAYFLIARSERTNIFDKDVLGNTHMSLIPGILRDKTMESKLIYIVDT